LHFLVFFNFSLSLQIEYVVAIYFSNLEFEWEVLFANQLFYCDVYCIICWMHVYANFYLLESSWTRGKKKSWCFVKRRIKKTTLEHPFFFPFPSFLPMHFFFRQQFEQEQFWHSSYFWKANNNKHVKVNDVATRILSY
jgi:hypothetical protein